MHERAACIFLSYRRDEMRHLAGRLADRMTLRFGPGNVFMDVNTIEPGADFRSVIVRAVSSCEVLLALIGPDWSAAARGGRRRLDSPDDLVVLEIGVALDRGSVVIPVLGDGAAMPTPDDLPPAIKELALRHAVRLDHESFAPDSERLLAAIERALRARTVGVLAGATRSASGPPAPRSVDSTERLPRVPIASGRPAAPAPTRGGPPAVPVYRHAWRIALWWAIFGLTVFGSVGFGLGFSPRSQAGVGGSLAGVGVFGLPILGLVALLRREIARQRRLVRTAVTPGSGWQHDDGNALSPLHIKKVCLCLAAMAALFVTLTLLFP